MELAVVASPGLGDTVGRPEAERPTAGDEATAAGGDAGAGPKDEEGTGALPEDAGATIGTTALGVGVVAVAGALAPTVVGVEAAVVVDVEVRSELAVPPADVGVSLGALAIPGKDPWYAASDCGALGRYTRLSGDTE